MSNLGDVLSKLALLKCVTDGGYEGLGAKPPAEGRFFEKKSYFNAIGSHFARVQSHFKELDF